VAFFLAYFSSSLRFSFSTRLLVGAGFLGAGWGFTTAVLISTFLVSSTFVGAFWTFYSSIFLGTVGLGVILGSTEEALGAVRFPKFFSSFFGTTF
jgi:hypothetical protein